jgi:hypothetical protein
MMSMTEPHRHVSRLKSGIDHADEVGADRVGVHRVLEPGRNLYVRTVP